MPCRPEKTTETVKDQAHKPHPRGNPENAHRDLCTKHSDKGSIPAWAGETHPSVTSPECVRTATDPSQTVQENAASSGNLTYCERGALSWAFLLVAHQQE